MGDKSQIEWTDATWNPIVGCSVISPGCTSCYAMRQAARIEAMSISHETHQGGDPGPMRHYRGTTKTSRAGAVWTGRVETAPDSIFLAPLRWRRPRMIFVNSMGDLFHDAIDRADVDRVFAVMALAPRHTFQLLTKRADRMRSYARDPETPKRVWDRACEIMDPLPALAQHGADWGGATPWPLRNVWMGVSAEDQARYDERVRELLATPAALRFVSAEPLIGPIVLSNVMGCRLIDWIISGGESGPGARPCWVPNVRGIVEQCRKFGIAVFVKQLGANVQDRDDAGFEGCAPSEWPDIDPARIDTDPNGYRDDAQGAPVRVRLRNAKGGDPREWPEDLRVRNLPARR